MNNFWRDITWECEVLMQDGFLIEHDGKPLSINEHRIRKVMLGTAGAGGDILNPVAYFVIEQRGSGSD